MKKEFLALPAIIMNLSLGVSGADDYSHNHERRHCMKSSTASSFDSSLSRQCESDAIKANLSAKYPIPQLSQKNINSKSEVNNISVTKNDIFEHSQQPNAITVNTGSMIANLLNEFSWKAYAYMYGNSTISYNFEDSQFDFNKDSSFYQLNSFGMNTGTYSIANGSLVLTFEDGFVQVHKEVFIEYNKESRLYFLMVSEQCDKYKGCYTVYMSTPKK